MSWIDEFKTFAIKGNAVDMAVGIIIGAAFSKVVNSVVSDLVMPVLGLLVGGIDMSAYKLTLKEAAGQSEAVVFNYGQFLNSLLSFLIVAFAVFLLIKAMNHLRGGVPETKEKVCPECQMTVPAKAKKCGHCQERL